MLGMLGMVGDAGDVELRVLHSRQFPFTGVGDDKVVRNAGRSSESAQHPHPAPKARYDLLTVLFNACFHVLPVDSLISLPILFWGWGRPVQRLSPG